METRNKIRKLSDEIRKKNCQGKGYMTVSRQLDVPGAIVTNTVKRFKVGVIIANLPGHEHKRKIEARSNRSKV